MPRQPKRVKCPQCGHSVRLMPHTGMDNSDVRPRMEYHKESQSECCPASFSTPAEWRVFLQHLKRAVRGDEVYDLRLGFLTKEEHAILATQMLSRSLSPSP